MTDSDPTAPARPWQIGDGLFGLLFAYSALVNLNDPDAPMWVALYSAGALAAGLDVFGRAPRRAVTVMGVLYLLAAGGLAISATHGSQHMKGFPQYGIFAEELVRESLGLGLVGLWLGALAIRMALAARSSKA